MDKSPTVPIGAGKRAYRDAESHGHHQLLMKLSTRDGYTQLPDLLLVNFLTLRTHHTANLDGVH